ncbi:uncharacterized protein SCODWIG_03590 [Saccharomycodes ludwigii]|uniref:Uncharacterized protein n=1 Tax=Saccharomycodes ludwigii TaxID=36035 RepID=A0A376BB67_9ASCO|nr:uncharacterized protein SCODWIG_03590 [Saccharomycodes ludwigii]
MNGLLVKKRSDKTHTFPKPPPGLNIVSGTRTASSGSLNSVSSKIKITTAITNNNNKTISSIRRPSDNLLQQMLNEADVEDEVEVEEEKEEEGKRINETPSDSSTIRTITINNTAGKGQSGTITSDNTKRNTQSSNGTTNTTTSEEDTDVIDDDDDVDVDVLKARANENGSPLSSNISDTDFDSNTKDITSVVSSHQLTFGSTIKAATINTTEKYTKDRENEEETEEEEEEEVQEMDEIINSLEDVSSGIERQRSFISSSGSSSRSNSISSANNAFITRGIIKGSIQEEEEEEMLYNGGSNPISQKYIFKNATTIGLNKVFNNGNVNNISNVLTSPLKSHGASKNTDNSNSTLTFLNGGGTGKYKNGNASYYYANGTVSGGTPIHTTDIGNAVAGITNTSNANITLTRNMMISSSPGISNTSVGHRNKLAYANKFASKSTPAILNLNAEEPNNSVSYTNNDMPFSNHTQFLTPSQRLRMRRQKSVKSTIRYRERYYEHQEKLDIMNNYENSSEYMHFTPNPRANKIKSTATTTTTNNNGNTNTTSTKNSKTHNIMKLSNNSTTTDFEIWNVPIAASSTSTFLTTMNTSINGKNNSASNNRKTKSLSSSSNATTSISGFPATTATTTSSSSKNLSSTHIQTSPLATPQLPVSQNLDYNCMQPSPIPGVTKKGRELNDFFQKTTNNLTQIYEASSKNYGASQLQKRKIFAESLPLSLKNASDEGFEDLTLVSEDKLQYISNSRPMWLPPKDVSEKTKHDKFIGDAINTASVEQMNRSNNLQKQLIMLGKNQKRLDDILSKGILTKQHYLVELRSMCWESRGLFFSNKGKKNNMLKTYNTLLLNDVIQLLERYQPFEKFTNNDDPQMLKDYPPTKTSEIIRLIQNNIPKYNNSNGNTSIPRNLLKLLQYKSFTIEGILPGDIVLFNHFLYLFDDGDSGTADNTAQEKNNLATIWNITCLLQSTVFNNSNVKLKFEEKIVAPSTSGNVIYRYLSKEASFSKEFNSNVLNWDNLWVIFGRISHDLLQWCLDIIVVNNTAVFYKADHSYYVDKLRKKLESSTHGYNKYEKLWEYWNTKYMVNNYKILLSLVLNVLLNYHFGFNDFNDLRENMDSKFMIIGGSNGNLGFDDDELLLEAGFIKKWLYYYKKF